MTYLPSQHASPSPSHVAARAPDVDEHRQQSEPCAGSAATNDSFNPSELVPASTRRTTPSRFTGIDGPIHSDAPGC